MGRNKIAFVFKVLAWVIFIGGFIAGCIFGTVETVGYYSSHTEFSIGRAMIVWSSSFVGGMLFLGLGEIIQLLQDLFFDSKKDDITRLLQNIQKTLDKK